MRHSRRGAALTEVLMAMLVVGLTTPFLFGVVMGGFTHARSSRDRALAAAWIQGELEYIRRQCYVRLIPGDRRIPPTRPGEPAVPDPFAGGHVRIEACAPEICPGVVGGELYRVAVSVSTTDWTGTGPPPAPFMSSVSYVGNIRMGNRCETSQ